MRLLIFFFFQNLISENYFRSTIIVSNSFDQDKAQPFVGPDLDQRCLQRLTADDTSGQRVNVSAVVGSNGMRGSYLNCGLVQIWIFMSSIGMVNTISHEFAQFMDFILLLMWPKIRTFQIP